MQGIDEVYHCAALVTFNPAIRAKRDQSHLNTESTANVVNRAMECGRTQNAAHRFQLRLTWDAMFGREDQIPTGNAKGRKLV
jgi:hypothetical protein